MQFATSKATYIIFLISFSPVLNSASISLNWLGKIPEFNMPENLTIDKDDLKWEIDGLKLIDPLKENLESTRELKINQTNDIVTISYHL
ncbi:hypothetical protein [Vibrio sp. 10N.222.55.A1]|uniref:hypothetical protein n=1 Tax=Vibrio sp. 10N.222.55.A1 TaxID=3229646 RepID=UPI0035531AAA